jgi:lysophospholipase L1-like esterase
MLVQVVKKVPRGIHRYLVGVGGGGLRMGLHGPGAIGSQMSMRFLVLGLAAGLVAARLGAADPVSAPTATSMNSTLVSARDSRIAYMGRLAFAGEEARMGYPGVTFRFVYRGPAPTLRFTATTGDCFFNLACNGWDPVAIRLNAGANEVPLPTGPAPATGWLVEVVRRTEAWQGLVNFAGLTLPAGCELLSPPAWPARRLMFIGDSITCGEYVERLPSELDSTPRSTNAGRSFGMLLGKWLNAQVHLVSAGGGGVIRDWEGKTDGINAPDFFQLALPDDPAAKWNPADYQPDAIVVSLGTNDFSKDLPDEALYTKAYDDFITHIRAAHPKAGILLAESAIFGDAPGTPDRAKRDQLRRTIEAVSARHRAAGDARIVVAPVGHYPGTPSNAHPVAFQHEQIALELLPIIRGLTGW